MKRALLASVAVLMVAAAWAASGNRPGATDLQIDVQERNPWTSSRLNNDSDMFHFVVVSDRTGGHRPRIFSEAVHQINLLQPQFVVSVGDLIEGYSKDVDRVRSEWKEFQSYTSKLQMPFFYVPGNHDVTNAVQSKEWKERFGRAYYHFNYRDVLFLCVNSDDPAESRDGDKENCRMSPEQIAYFKKVLEENSKVRWIVVLLHKPMWIMGDLAVNGWGDFEKLLNGRQYTVFCGHVHRYQKFVRQGMNYYQLATTGGGSKLRGLDYGEFDQIAWITMPKTGGPIIANVMLDGIYPEDLKRTITEEEGYTRYNMKPPVKAAGRLTLKGAPAAGAVVAFHPADAKDLKKSGRVCDAIVAADGSFVMSTYKAWDGCPAGSYVVTATLRTPTYDALGKATPNRLPAEYAAPDTSPLRVTVTSAGPNQFELEMK